MDGRSLARLKRELDEFAGELLVDLPRRDQRAWAVAYLRGLLLDGDRKSVGPMAERLAAIDHEPAGSRRDYEQALQQFVGQSTWPADAVRDRLQRWLAARGRRRATAADAAAADLLILDDIGFPKQGKASVGVARQYTGTLGKVASCQVAVTLQHARQPAADTAAGGEVFCVDARLYLPKRGWCDDRPRLDRAGVPPDVGYQPKCGSLWTCWGGHGRTGWAGRCWPTACSAPSPRSAGAWTSRAGRGASGWTRRWR